MPINFPVIFRADNDSGEVTAVFPTSPADARGSLAVCYAHVGQHGACSREWYEGNTRPATADEYARLLDELRAIGYGTSENPLIIVDEWTHRFDKSRRYAAGTGHGGHCASL